MRDLEKAVTFHKQGKLHEAEKHYYKAMGEDLDNVDCLYMLGTLFLTTGRAPLASQLFMRVVVMKDDHFEAWNNLGNCYKAENMEKEAESCWRKALSVKNRNNHEYAERQTRANHTHLNQSS
jgi:tetratricopeptide (TPR) repeat protein